MVALSRNHVLLWLILTMAVASCTSPSDPSAAAPQAPTSLRVSPVSATSIKLSWDAALDELRTGFKVVVSAGNNVLSTETLSNEIRSTTVSDLSAGTTYTFAVYALNGTTPSATSAALTWAPSLRYTMKVYEPDSENGCGVQLGHPVSLLLPAAFKWDLTFEITKGAVFFGSPIKSSFADTVSGRYSNGDSVRRTLIGRVWEGVQSLEATYADIGNLSTDTYAPRRLNLSTTQQSVAMTVKTHTGHYARVLVKSVDGRLVQGTAPDRYLELDVSYQQAAGVPFAKQ